jgi:ABC-type sugar transport system ATPase subunit
MSTNTKAGQSRSDRPILEVRQICKSFPGVRVLKSVNLSVWPGEVHAFMGENGAGKSTLMKILAGAYQATPVKLSWMVSRSIYGRPTKRAWQGSASSTRS